MSIELTPLVRGTDWAETMTEWRIDNVIQDLSLYEWDCQFKCQKGVDKPVTVLPTIVLDSRGLTISIADTDTIDLPVGNLYFNILATQNDITQQVVHGVVEVQAGVSRNDV